jgi:hypothetical protein
MSHTQHDDYHRLQRSPSLMSRSSGASTPPPATPSLSSSTSTSGASALHYLNNNNSIAASTSSTPSYKTNLPRSNTSHAFLSGTSNGQHHHASAPPEKGILAYQSKYLSRTASIQSLSNVGLPYSASSSASFSASGRATSPDNNNHNNSNISGSGSTTSRTHKRTTWAPGHRLPGSGSVSSVDDIMGRFGGGNGSGSARPTTGGLGGGLASSASSNLSGYHNNNNNSTPRASTPTSSYGIFKPLSPVKNSFGNVQARPAGTGPGYATTKEDNHTAAPTSWRSSLARSATQKSDSENVAPFPSSSSSSSTTTTYTREMPSTSSSSSMPSSASRRFNSNPSSPTSFVPPSSSSSSSSRPLSPTAYGGAASTASSYSPHYRTTPISPPASSSSSHAHAAPLESEIMRHSFSDNSASSTSQYGGNSANHKPKQPSFHLGNVNDLGHSNVGLLRNFREFAITTEDRSDSTNGTGANASGGRESPSSLASYERKFTVSGGGTSSSSSARLHRRTQTLPSLGDVGATTSSASSTSNGRDRHNSVGADSASRTTVSSSASSRYACPNGTKLNMHGLDRLSERSDTSLNDDDDVRYHGSSASPSLGLGLPSSPHSTAAGGRRMASDAGENETGSIVIPGITVGSDNVAGLNGRLRLARQPTQTKYGTLPSVTVKAMEVQRQCLQAYEYLCHVSEAKEWLVDCLSAHPLIVVNNSNGSPEVPFSPSATADGAGDEDDPSGLSGKSVVELEEALRNGVALARLARAFMGDKAVPRIFTVSLASETVLRLLFTHLCVLFACRPLDLVSVIQII